MTPRLRVLFTHADSFVFVLDRYAGNMASADMDSLSRSSRTVPGCAGIMVFAFEVDVPDADVS